jgi:hypothetical protein
MITSTNVIFVYSFSKVCVSMFLGVQSVVEPAGASQRLQQTFQDPWTILELSESQREPSCSYQESISMPKSSHTNTSSITKTHAKTNIIFE